MLEHLPEELRDGLMEAQRRGERSGARLQVRADGHRYPVVRHWPGGFALDAAAAPHIRGLVDIHRGADHLYRCLIVACTESEGEIRYEFKQSTRADDDPPCDFERPDGEERLRLPG